MASPLAYRNGSLRAFGHPVHVLLIHFPLGLWPLVFPLELAGWLGGWEAPWRLAFWANAAGVAAALPAAATGLIDLAGLKGSPAAARVANLHMAVMLGAASLFGAELCFHPPGAAIAGPRAFVNLGLTFLGMSALLWGGWLGGELVLRHGAGRIAEGPHDRQGAESGG
jgi:uncharacterized membrane protein